MTYENAANILFNIANNKDIFLNPELSENIINKVIEACKLAYEHFDGIDDATQETEQ